MSKEGPEARMVMLIVKFNQIFMDIGMESDLGSNPKSSINRSVIVT